MEITRTEFNQLKQDPTHVHYHYDHVKRTAQVQWDIFNKHERNIMPAGSESRGTNLQRHDLFPGYVNSKPQSLQK